MVAAIMWNKIGFHDDFLLEYCWINKNILKTTGLLRSFTSKIKIHLKVM